MASKLKYIWVLRPLNLLLLGISQILIWKILKEHAFVHASYINFILLIFATVTIAGFANAINDYYDIKADLLNKPSKVYFPISNDRTLLYYCYYLAIVAIFSTVFLFISTTNSLLFWLMIFQVPLSILYSKYFKKVLLIGNLIIALQVVLVLYVVYVLNGLTWNTVLSTSELFFTQIMVFTFLSHLGREIIKDVQDIEGDNLLGAQTIPLVFGTIRAGQIVSVILIILGCIHLNFWLRDILSNPMSHIVNAFCVVMLVISYIDIQKLAFPRVSMNLKLYMLLGILFFFIL